ncbi:hypothetical protein [Schlesneria paludicola]|uniref:hypothetical protein n=1 Tax=Schlesneria paludicola TaxID=360056 RepID=UPI0012F8AB30|nr:hypothetical protein [Schlesneria paludicola]
MFAYFRGWKRKLGILTLAIACLLTVGWVRSRSVADTLYIHHNRGMDDIYVSCAQGMIWMRNMSADPRHKVTPRRGSVSWFSDTDQSNFDSTDWKSISNCWFARIRSYGTKQQQAGIVLIRYWLIVVPLTLLTAYLLLSKPVPTLPTTTPKNGA